MVSRMEMFQDLMRQYRRNPDQFTDEQAEKIAREAKRLGIRFPRESKFGRKLAFDAVDSLALGMVPNSWRPKSRGEATFGETDADKWAGRLGLLGAVPTLGAGIAGRGAIWAGTKGAGKAFIGSGAKAYGAGARAVSRYAPQAQSYGAKASDYARKLVNDAPNIAGRAGVKVNNARNYVVGKANGMTSLERGSSTVWNPFKESYRRFTDPWRDQNLLDGVRGALMQMPRGGIPRAPIASTPRNVAGEFVENSVYSSPL
jgi:hypothetical protein